MTGRVVSKPPQKHQCSPGWTWKPHPDGGRYGIPPHVGDYPKGTVWECDCGTKWVSLGRRGVGNFFPVWDLYRPPIRWPWRRK